MGEGQGLEVVLYFLGGMETTEKIVKGFLFLYSNDIFYVTLFLPAVFKLGFAFSAVYNRGSGSKLYFFFLHDFFVTFPFYYA